jgi:eukaryotic-like serine/threonine-protein kinase
MELPSPGTVVAGKYRLESLLGTGGMGAVYRAQHLLMDSSVALKWLRPDMAENREARERLLREAQWAARIRHPNVVQVYDVDAHDGMPFMVMELLEGETFADVIARGQLGTPAMLRLLLGALQGLAAAHELGIVHRDIKPENIFVVRTRGEGVAKLLDFGVSKIDKLDPHSARLTQTGTAVGTPLYMPVEQLTASSDVDARADVYAFGVVLYHALSGELPFDAETFAGVVLNIATAKPRPLRQLRPELPSALDRLVMKAMARRREDRFPNVPALIEALRAVADSLETPRASYANTPNLDSMEALLRGDRRRSWRLGFGVAALAAIALALTVWSLATPTPVAHDNPVQPRVVAPLPEVPPPAPPIVEVAPLPPSAPKPRPAPVVRAKAKRGAPVREPAVTLEPAPTPPLPTAPKRAPVGKSGGLLREDF